MFFDSNTLKLGDFSLEFDSIERTAFFEFLFQPIFKLTNIGKDSGICSFMERTFK